MKTGLYIIAWIAVVLSSVDIAAQDGFKLAETFAAKQTTYEKMGRGDCMTANDLLVTRNAWAGFGKQEWSDYEIGFRARTPATEQQVQIWAGFREHNRNDRYVIALRGGRQDNLYLSRLGYMGTDEFLALRPLDFHPLPGIWYQFRIVVCGDRIRVFLDKESLPRIDITDKNSGLAPSGKITLGGGWIRTEYDDLVVTGISHDRLANIPKQEYVNVPAVKDKNEKRIIDRAAYHPIIVNKITRPRTTVSLNGQWLFMPLYELPDEQKAVSTIANDDGWHSMNVPDFWNPIRIWLHGETFGPHSKGASDAYFQKETDRCEGYTFDYRKTAAAWYRQWVELPDNIKGKDIRLDFDAVSKVAEVWINGVHAGSHTGMFGNFSVHDKGMFKPGRNLVVVKVVRDYLNDIKDAGKVVDVAVSVEVTNKMLKDIAHGFYTGDPAGIWQPVSLVITDPLQISDIFIKPGLTGAAFEITVKNTDPRDKTFEVVTSIRDKKGKLLYNGKALQQLTVRSGEEKRVEYAINNLKPLLWTPGTPALYDFTFRLVLDKRTTDSMVICSGFRTFEAKDGYLVLNGKRYWLRGGNQTPFALAPNSRELAGRFYDLMKAGNMEVTRTHTTPYNELWMDEADRKGVGVSFEGTWPWLMLSTSMPDEKLINLWAEEFLSLLKKYRNHPSLLFWTVNNEMKFYDNDPDLGRARIKMKIISDVVKRMRAIDPTRPMCFDSNYKRKGKEKKFGTAFFSTIDDGDIDDAHAYINWYDHTIFREFNGEFQRDNLTPGRPLISQEMSTGYPNSETGHPARFYTQVHQTPQTLVGDLAYEFSDPAYFLEAQSFITGELAEALRRTNDSASGILHFALLTWFKNVYDPKTIAPHPAYYAMKRALQPVLVSAELWGRHFYAGARIPVRVCIVNDSQDGADLGAIVLQWKLVDGNGRTITSGSQQAPPTKYYTRQWLTPVIDIPSALPADRTDARLLFSLKEEGKEISANEYTVLLAGKEWCKVSAGKGKKIVLVDRNQISNVFDFLHMDYKLVSSVGEAVKESADVYVFSGIDPDTDLQGDDSARLKALVREGGRVLLLNAEGVSRAVYPEYIKDWFEPTEGEIVNIDIPESPVFNDIEPLDLRYFTNNKREIPVVCHSALRINRSADVEILAKHIKVHGYLNGNMESRQNFMKNIEGATIIKIHDKGIAIISTMSLEKGVTDPVPGKLLANMLDDLFR